MTDSLSALLYLVASVCFIMALRGLSSPDTARAGNIYGIAGMAIAILTTLVTPQIVSYWLIIVGALIAAGPVGMSYAKIMGFVAVTMAAVNIFGDFIVTQRMLQMFQRKK